jgi:NAD(P)-dependent dehydrogenase (short-subunit alcohol dehydrogenase family)
MFSQAERIVGINLLGAIRGAEMAIKQATASLTKRADLDVIVTASTNGLVPADSDLAPVYVATKFGIIGFVRSLQPLASRYGVRVNAIAPVTVDTPMVAGLIPPEVRVYLETGGRGGIMPSSTCATALLYILDNPSLSGEVVTVHPDAPGGRGFAIEPLVASPWLGAWRDAESAEVAAFVDEGLNAAADGSLPAWSGI